jgi:hypothetical protein
LTDTIVKLLVHCLLAVASTAAAGESSELDPSSATNAAASAPAQLHFMGDARYRYEAIDAFGTSYDRQRVRARFGVDAEITPATHAVFKLSTGAGDPRSAHITFSGGYSRKEVGVDLAYLEWKLDPEISVAAGKLPHPTWRASQSLFIGGDFNPEGLAASYVNESGLFVSAYSFWLADHGTNHDAKQNGTQVGYGSTNGAEQWKLAVSYNDFSHVRGAMPFLDGVNAFGNSTRPDGSFSSAFEIVDTSAQWTHKGLAGSVTLFSHLAHNAQAQRGADAFAGGVEYAPNFFVRDWSVSYQYARIGQDSLFGQLMDGDFGGGVTDSRGHVVRASFRPAARSRATLSYFHNQVGQPEQHDEFRLLQLDLDFLF